MEQGQAPTPLDPLGGASLEGRPELHLEIKAAALNKTLFQWLMGPWEERNLGLGDIMVTRQSVCQPIISLTTLDLPDPVVTFTANKSSPSRTSFSFVLCLVHPGRGKVKINPQRGLGGASPQGFQLLVALSQRSPGLPPQLPPGCLDP